MKIYILILVLLMIPLVSSEIETLGTFKIGECIQLKQTCSNCSYVNLTSILYPNSTAAFSGTDNMTKDGTDYTYEFCKTDALGEYIVNGVGDVDETPTVFAYNFYITRTGTQIETSHGIIYFIFLIGSMVIFGLCLWGGLKIPWRNKRGANGSIIGMNDLKYVKILLLGLSYLFLFLITGLLRGITFDYLPDIAIYKTFQIMYTFMLAGLYPILIISCLIALMTFLNDRKIKKALQNGLDVEDE